MAAFWDAALPGSGLAHGALHEFAGGGSGTVDGAAAALFAAGVAARDIEDESGEQLCVFRSGDGVDPETGSHRWFCHGISA